MLGLHRGDRGFTLIETLAAITVFFLVTVGVLPLLTSSIRGSTLARSTTLGKSVGEQAMERVRGLPFRNSRTTQKLDVLDFYFPNYEADGSPGTFETVCPSGSTDAACPRPIPEGYTVTFNASFVKPTGATPESYEVVIPLPAYNWTAAGAGNAPPATAQFLRMEIITSWRVNGQLREFPMTSLLGERKTGSLTIDGVARIDHFIEVLTSFNISGSRSDLIATAGVAESRVESRLLTTADQVVTSGDASLTDSNNPRQFTDVEAVGATGSANAPPNTTSDPVSESATSLLHPQLPAESGAVATFGGTTVSGVNAQQSLGLPSAAGDFSYTVSDPIFLVNNQADTSSSGTGPKLLIAPTGRVVWMTIAGTQTLFGRTVGATTGPGTPRKVQTTATLGGSSGGAAAATVNILPAQFIPGNGPVIEISNFEATVNCPSTGAAGTAPVAEWSANLRYWRETDPRDNVSAGSYVAVETSPGAGLTGSVNTSTTPRADPLAALATANPVVHEVVDPLDPTTLSAVGSERDIHLFPTTHTHTETVTDGDEDGEEEGEADDTVREVVHNHPGYLSTWASLVDTVAASDDAVRNTSARIDGAITISTTPTNPAITPSALNISIGSMSCYALDRRL